LERVDKRMIRPPVEPPHEREVTEHPALLGAGSLSNDDARVRPVPRGGEPNGVSLEQPGVEDCGRSGCIEVAQPASTRPIVEDETAPALDLTHRDAERTETGVSASTPEVDELQLELPRLRESRKQIVGLRLGSGIVGVGQQMNAEGGGVSQTLSRSSTPLTITNASLTS
jgi:hypothetical protein